MDFLLLLFSELTPENAGDNEIMQQLLAYESMRGMTNFTFVNLTSSMVVIAYIEFMIAYIEFMIAYIEFMIAYIESFIHHAYMGLIFSQASRPLEFFHLQKKNTHKFRHFWSV
jgi:hypothetical protein